MRRIAALIHKYKHAWLLLYACIYLPWFCYLERTVTGNYHVMHAALDDLIPFCEYFIIPYLLWFPYVAVTVAYFFFTSKNDYYRLCAFLFTGMTISLLVCTLFPNGTNFRPHIDPDKNIFCLLVSKLWKADTCTNVFPSIHVYNSLGVHIAVSHSERLRKHRFLVAGSGILMVLIMLSTIFLKQHSILDVIGAGVMACVLYQFVYAAEKKKEPHYAKQKRPLLQNK